MNAFPHLFSVIKWNEYIYIFKGGNCQNCFSFLFEKGFIQNKKKNCSPLEQITQRAHPLKERRLNVDSTF